MRKLTLVLIILIVLILAIFLYFLFFNQKDECSDYKQIGFSSKDECYLRVVSYGYIQHAQEGKYDLINWNYCEKIIGQYYKDICYDNLAYIKQDKTEKLEFCNKIVNTTIKDSCTSAASYNS
jgi:hypothetical protein